MNKKVPTANKMPGKSSVISTIAALGIACSSIASANLKFIEVPEQQLAEIRGKIYRPRPSALF
jgi:hypothetical protein